MLWILFIFRWLLTQELAPVAYDDKQGDLCGPTSKPALDTINVGGKWLEDLKNEVEWATKVEMKRDEFPAAGEACTLYSDLLQALKGQLLIALGSQLTGP